MSLRTEYIRNFYADHQTNFGQPDGTPTATVRAAALREFDEWLRDVKAEAWDEGHHTRVQRGPDDCACNAWNEGECACGEYGNGPIITPNPYRNETA